METGKPHAVDLSDVAEEAVTINRLITQAKKLSDEIDRLITQAKKLSDGLVTTVSMLNSVVQTQGPKDGD